MFTKIYLSRAQTRAMSIDHPVGDPTGGAAYREMRDPATAIGASAATSLIGAKIGADASKSAANTQVDAAREAQATQLALAQEAIKAQQDVLNTQLRAQQGVMDSQLKAQFDALAQQKTALDNAYREQTNIAAQTRDQQVAAAQAARGEQFDFASANKNAQLDLAQGVLKNQVATYDPYNQAGLAGQNRLLEYLGIGGNAGATDYGKYASAEFTPAMFKEGIDPGYGFRISEGLKAVDRQAAARGGLISGNALKASQTYGQDMASQEYTNAYNRFQTSRAGTLSPLQALQGVGFNAATGIANAYGQYGQAGSNALTNYGNIGSNAIGTAGGQTIGALGGYGTAAGNAAGSYGTNTAGATGTYGSNVSNIYGAKGTQEQQAYANYINSLTGSLTGYGNNASNLTTGAGNVTASGYVGQANAINSGISNISNAYYQNQMLNLLKDRQNSGLTDAQANQLMGSYPSINSSGLRG
jgi:hypothetical protein